jgi:adenylyltransferase/sulfurtransferase
MIGGINPDVKVIRHDARLGPANAAEIIRQYDIVADGSDNFETRFLVNDTCFHEKKPLVSAALSQFEGQITTYRAFEGGNLPCYRCLFPAPPGPNASRSCAEAGILGALAGVMGSMQALEVIKEILELGESLAGHLLIYDALDARIRKIRFEKDPDCALCGDKN